MAAVQAFRQRVGAMQPIVLKPVMSAIPTYMELCHRNVAAL